MKYIIITDQEILKLSTNRLLNIYKINRKYIFQTLFNFGFDTSNGGININYSYVDDDLFHHREFNAVSFLNNKIRKELSNRKYKNESI